MVQNLRVCTQTYVDAHIVLELWDETSHSILTSFLLKIRSHRSHRVNFNSSPTVTIATSQSCQPTKTSTLLPYEVRDIARNKADQLLLDPEQLIQNPSDSARHVSRRQANLPPQNPRCHCHGSALLRYIRGGQATPRSRPTCYMLLTSTAALGRVCRPSMYHTTMFHHRF